ncbi:MAG: hypothetical protein HZB50_02750 [Chloroflexi bacterium]|nr:hypothetical protein [Chloroflexota bacterium]
MNTRQAIIIATCISLLIGLSACSSSNEEIPTQTVPPPTPTVTATFTPSPVPVTSTPTPKSCTEENGLVQQDVVKTTNPPQEFLIYLPPCYQSTANAHFPVLYLLHGQTYTDDQWVRLGVPTIADRLIHEGKITPFIIVFPDDHYWNVPAGAGFGDRFINDLIPYVDKNYHTFAVRSRRSLGGLSRGGGWVVDLGFSHPELFGALGLHSPAIKVQDGPRLEKMVQAVPENKRPLIWLDLGDADIEMKNTLAFEEKLTKNNYIFEFHVYTGDHSERYWGTHVEEYLLWYAQKWAD